MEKVTLRQVLTYFLITFLFLSFFAGIGIYLEKELIAISEHLYMFVKLGAVLSLCTLISMFAHFLIYLDENKIDFS